MRELIGSTFCSQKAKIRIVEKGIFIYLKERGRNKRRERRTNGKTEGVGGKMTSWLVLK